MKAIKPTNKRNTELFFQTSDENGFQCEVVITVFPDSLDECCFLLCVHTHT